MTLCDETIKGYPNTEGAKNCEALREQIFYKNISITTEKAAVPNEAFKALVQYKNIERIYLKIVPIDYKTKEQIFNLKNKETQ